MLAPTDGYRPYGPDVSRTIGHFENISDQLRRTDDRLERDEYNRTEPGHNWSSWFAHAANDLSRARYEFDDATRGDYAADDVSRRLAHEVRNLQDRSEQLASMDYHNDTFGYGWGRVLDNAIDTVDDAIRLLRRR